METVKKTIPIVRINGSCGRNLFRNKNNNIGSKTNKQLENITISTFTILIQIVSVSRLILSSLGIHTSPPQSQRSPQYVDIAGHSQNILISQKLKGISILLFSILTQFGSCPFGFVPLKHPTKGVNNFAKYIETPVNVNSVKEAIIILGVLIPIANNIIHGVMIIRGSNFNKNPMLNVDGFPPQTRSYFGWSKRP